MEYQEYPRKELDFPTRSVSTWRYATDIELVEWKIKTNNGSSLN